MKTLEPGNRLSLLKFKGFLIGKFVMFIYLTI